MNTGRMAYSAILLLCVSSTVGGACTPYTKPQECEHPAHCYNAATCTCGLFPVPKCPTDPCDENECASGFKCVVNSCGGCNHQCVRDIPTKTPALVTKCTPYNLAQECEHPAHCYNAATCTCGLFPVPKCPTDPCDENECASGFKCVVNSCGGCNHRCIPTKTPAPVAKCTPYTKPQECEHPAHCYNAATCTCGLFPVPKCPTDPCDANECAPGTKCVVNSCGGCNHQCVRDIPTKTPAPVAKCTPYNLAQECEHPAHCYNAATCTCGLFPVPKCPTDPCDENECASGFKCVVNSCGGCNHQCVRDIPTKTPAPVTKCTPYNLAQECEHPAHCYNAATCTCGLFPVPKCPTDPCDENECVSGTKCVVNSCGGCNHQCIPTKTPAPVAKCTPYNLAQECEHPAHCYNAATCTCGLFPVPKCPTDPCDENECASGFKCVVNSCGGCNHRCIPTKTPAPVAKCTPYTKPQECEHPAHCYNAATCTCGLFPVPKCPTDPCDENECASGFKCVVNSCGGCNHQCIPTKTPAPVAKCTPYNLAQECEHPAHCYNAATCTCGLFPVPKCPTDPCDENECASGFKCVVNSCGGCNHRCIPTKTPAPVAKCTPYNLAQECEHPAHCYNAATCTCGLFPVPKCPTDPCDENECASGFKCVVNSCGGCNHQCVRDIPTKTPAPVAKCTPYNLAQECEHPAHCYNAATCTCGLFPVPTCPTDPCDENECAPGTKCVVNSCGGCNHQCIPTKTPAPVAKCTPYNLAQKCEHPAHCYNAATCTCGLFPVPKCPTDPCDENECVSGTKCVVNSCGGCNHRCVRVPILF